MRKGPVIATVVGLLVLGLGLTLRQKAAQREAGKAVATPGPMLGQGLLNVETPEFTLSLVRSSQTVAALKPKGAGSFDFTPGDLLVERSQDGYYHLRGPGGNPATGHSLGSCAKLGGGGRQAGLALRAEKQNGQARSGGRVRDSDDLQ